MSAKHYCATDFPPLVPFLVAVTAGSDVCVCEGPCEHDLSAQQNTKLDKA